MALFGFGKDKKDGGAQGELVLAWFEDAQRVRAPFILNGRSKTEVPAVLQGLDENEGTATFQTTGPLRADKGATVEFSFIQEGLRLGGSARLADVRPGIAVLELPEGLEVKERRGQPRARLNPKEGATCTALTGLFEGVGITGVIENISESGLRLRVEKAMSIKGEKRLPLGTALVPEGQPFMLIKLNKVPKCPAVMEVEGQAAYLEQGNGSGLAMGIRFAKPKADVASAIRSLVSSRTSPLPTSLPSKTRRKAEAQASSALADEPLVPTQRSRPQAASKPQAAPAPEAQAPQAPAAPQPSVPAPSAPVPAPAAPRETPEAPTPEETQARQDPLLRLKKRSRAVVALTRTAAFTEMLKDFLQEDGFGRVLTTTFPDEVPELLRQPNLGVLLLDGDMSIVEALEFVQHLRSSGPGLPPVIVAAEDISTAVVLAARRNGVSQLVVRPYALDQAFSTLLASQLA
jgi:CheY-like chemotaxis protein